MEVPWGRLLFLTLLCVVSSLADSACKNSCKGDGGPFLPGQVYKYQLEGSSVTQLPGASGDVTSLGITATAEVFAESKCQHVLKLSNVQVKGPDGKSYDGLAADCAKPVKFSYNDGKLAELCGENDDRGAGLNIKRAVISLVSSVKRSEDGGDHSYENDVFGICPTDFIFSKDGTKIKIHKSRNLNRCALREDFNFPFPTSTYQTVQSSFGTFETSPLLGAQLTVNQEIDSGVLQKATGEEVYTYRPLVNPEAGAVVKVTYTLTLQGAGAGAIPANAQSSKQVFFENAHDDDGVKNHQAILAALQKATASVDPTATPEAAKHFADLVHVIEQGSKADILQAYNAAQGKTAKSIFLDGLLYAGSADSVEAAAELLSSKKIPEESARLWYLDLNFVKHVSRGSLNALVPLLSGKVPTQAYLGIGSVAGKFCLEHRNLCETGPEFKALQTKLAEPLNSGCKTNDHEKENLMIASLKGLRNSRHLTDEVAQKVIKCALDKTAKSRVRVAAIEAFHADPSKAEIKQTATTIFKDVEEDSELRIKAYLSLVESPCPKVADTVKELIDSEPINQVGAFVVSHLRNLRASVNPEKEAAKHFLGNIISKKKYPIDQRKFSRNYEVSYSLDAVNLGAVGELNRIFSQKSFIPRSVSLNLTTQIFGHSFNFAEIGLRAENLERYFEKYFGPKGMLNTESDKMVDEFGEKTEEALKKAEDAIKRAKEKLEAARPKRSVSKQEADTATNKIELGPDYEDLHTDLDLSIKLFGSEMGWLNYHLSKANYEKMKKDLHTKVDETLDKTKSIDIDFKKARRFLDVGVTYPTGLGFGLKVHIDGSSAVNIKVNGKLDAKAIANQPQNTHIAFQIVPSGNIELTSLLAVNAHVVETGVKVSANIHSSTGSDLTVKVLDGYGVDVKLGLPVKKQEILNLNVDVVSTVRENKAPEVESPIKFNVKRQEHGGCFDQLSPLTGLTFCGSFSIPMEGVKLLSPAYGPSKASIHLEKDDESLTTYHFRAFYNNKEPNKLALEVLLDTPNSKTNRKFALNVQGTMKPKKQLLITFVSPFKEATLEGLVIDEENEQSVLARFETDGLEYSLKAGAHVSGDPNRRKYEPLLEYKYPEAPKSERAWIGRKGAAKGGRSEQKTLGVTGAVYVEKTPNSPYRKYELKSVTLTTPKMKVTVDGIVTVDNNLVATDLKASYEKETLTLNSKVQKLEDHKYIAKIEFASSQYPDLGGSIKWEYERSKTKVENKLVVVHGPDLKSETSRLSVSQLLTYKYENVNDFEFSTENSVSYPLLGISAGVKGSATPKTLQYDIDITYDKSQVKSKLDAKIRTKHPTDYSIDFEGKAFGNSVDFTSKHERVTPTKSKFTNSLEMKPGGKYQLNGLAEWNSKPGDIHQSLDVELKLPQDPKIVKIKTELKHNNKEEELEFELIAGNKRVIDIEFLLLKKAEPSGKFKLSLPKYIEGDGAFETKNKKSTGSFNLNIVKTGRKIEGRGELVKSGTTYKGNGDILWDAKKDPTKKFHIVTDTDIHGKSISTKNMVQFLDQKVEFSLKGDMQGTMNDGTLIGEAEVVLPNGQVVGAKMNRQVQLGTDNSKIEGTYELTVSESKGAAPRKVVLKLAGKNINPSKLQFDGQVDLTYTTPQNKEAVLHVVGKKMPQGGNWIIAGQGSLTGSLIKHPIHTKLNADVSDQLMKGHLTDDKKLPPGHYDFEFKAGNDVTFNANGKINQDQLNNDVELKLPADLPVKSFKWKTANTLSIFVGEGAARKVATNNEVHWNGDRFVKMNLENTGEQEACHGKITMESHAISARSLTYKMHGDRKKQMADLDLALTWEGKAADLKLKVDGASNPIHVHVVSNVPNRGAYELDLSHKVSQDGDSRETIIKASGNGKNMNYHSRYSKSRTSPYVDVSLELPQGKSRAYAKIEKKGAHHVLWESKLNWFVNGGGNFDMDGEVNMKSVEDFYVKLALDSPKLNLDKVELEAKTAGKTVTFHGKNGDKEISGNMALTTAKGTLPNIHYEGSGEIKVGANAYPIEMKLKNELDKDQRKHESELDLKIGKRTFNSKTVAERDDSAALFKLDSVSKYCGEKGCRNDEIKIHSQRTGLDFETKSNIKLDLSTHMILEHPLVLNGHWKKEGLKYDSKIDVECGPEKLHYHGYINEEHAGVELSLPKRVVAAEVNYDLGSGKKFKIDANFWLDKNKAADKTSVLLLGEANSSPDSLQTSSEARFNTPGLRELSVKGDLTLNTKDRTVNAKLEADIFAKKNQKLVAEYKAVAKKEKDSYSANDNLHIHSKGLEVETKVERKVAVTKTSFSYVVSGYYTDSKHAKREAEYKISTDPKSFVLLLKIPEGTLFSADLSIERGDKQIHSKGKYEVLNYKFEEDFELKGTRMKVTVIQKTDGNPQLDVDLGFTVGQVAEINGKFNKKSFVSLEVALDEAHFLKSKHSYNTDVAKELLKLSKENSVGLLKEGSRIVRETGTKLAHEVNERVDLYRKALPNLKPAVTHYQKELQEMRDEFTVNKNIQNLIDFLKNTFGTIFTTISTIIEEITSTMERIHTILNETYSNISESLKSSLIPKLKKEFEKISEMIVDLVDDLLKQAMAVVNTILDKIKEHEKDIQELTSVVTDFIQDFGQLIAKSVGELQKDVKDFLKVIWDQVQAMPAYSMLKEKLQEIKNYKLPEQFWDGYHESVTSVVQVLPTPELQLLVKTLAEYLEKIIKQEPINTPEVLKELYKEAVAAVRSVIAIIEAYKPEGEKGAFFPTNFILPIPSFSMLIAPPGLFRFSLINWVQSSDLPTLSEIFHTYRPQHSPLDVLPPFTASASLIGGTEFFTFDKKHYSFKGSCSYILSKDVIDGNFTIVANMEAGKLKSIAAFDHQNGLELMNDNSVLFNGKPTELPIHEGDLHMWTMFEAGTGFATNSGVMFFCAPHLKHCAFSINGFYFAKTRGLLGTYNYEPYDDTITPAGKVAKSVGEFANSWKVSPQCPDGAAHEQPAPQAEECNKLFAGDSSLRACFAFENPDNFREACNRKVAESADKQDQACNVAQVYLGYCHYVHFLRLKLPDHCGKCEIGTQTVQVGQSAPVLTPQKQADVVFVVEQLENNKEVFDNLVTPLVSTLTNDFKEKGIMDVKFALIGFGAADQEYPAVYTINGKYNGFSGSAPNIYFKTQPVNPQPKLSDRLKDIKKWLKVETGTTTGGMALKEAFNYPFRPGAVKTVIGVLGSPCSNAVLPLQPLRLLLARLKMLSSETVVHLVTPLEDLKIEGKDEKTAANVVGFDSDSVYMQSEAKRKVLKGDEDAHKNLKYTSDVCVDLALNVNGAVFSSTNFVKGKPNLRKNFLQVLSSKVTDSLTSAELKQECFCEFDRGMVPKTKCRVISRQEKEIKDGLKG